MNSLIVKLWGKEIGRLIWIPSKRESYFMINPENTMAIDFAPLVCPLGKWPKLKPVVGEEEKIYQRLPSFIADSLPDEWGNTLFEQWAKQNKIPISQISPFLKLIFIGKRGMGALEFEPSADKLDVLTDIDIHSLYDLSLKILEDRENLIVENDQDLTMSTLISVGTSAGGRQMKAVIAVDNSTGEIRSGQGTVPECFDHYIIKFQNSSISSTEIEMAYHDMAVDCGIVMEECCLMKVDGINHFRTKRFDRKGNKKIHIQTLAAINPEARTYHDLFDTARRLGITNGELTQLYRRMVFNILANNTDDHRKNFSFLLEEGGKWQLSPAYDLTFIFNRYLNGGEKGQSLSMYGKTMGITIKDLEDFAYENGIKSPRKIIDETAEVISRFASYASRYGLDSHLTVIIKKTLDMNLQELGYIKNLGNPVSFIGSQGKRFENISMKINRKGLYEITCMIDGVRKKRFIKSSEEVFDEIERHALGAMEEVEFQSLIESLFR